MAGVHIEALITFMKRAIVEEDTFFGTKGQFVFIVWTKIRPANTTTNTQQGIIWRSIKESL
jgi:hypothetical protein